LPAEPQHPGAGLQRAGRGVQQRGLAGARGADHRHLLTGGQLHAEGAQRGRRASACRGVLHVQRL
jgi:hypothetical protein